MNTVPRQEKSNEAIKNIKYKIYEDEWMETKREDDKRGITVLNYANMPLFSVFIAFTLNKVHGL